MIKKEVLERSLYNRTSVNQTLITLNGYKRYLEIGCDNNQTFGAIRCETKVGVDPNRGGTLRMTSDDFFSQNNEQFDIVFIDGNHHHDQVIKDMKNSLSILSPGGMIVMHDCNPRDISYESQLKCGTAWRAFATYRMRSDLDMIVCNFDHGVGLVRLGDNRNIINVGKTMDELMYDDLIANRDVWLNLRSPREIAEWLLEPFIAQKSSA